MSRFKPLSCQTKKHFVVIRKNRSYPIKTITDFLDNHYEKWALICHKQDEDPTTHLVIPTHYHYVGIGLKDKTPMQTYLNALAKHLKTDTNGIEFDSYRSLEGALQYLIHKNNPEKTQHEIKEIVFGGWSYEEIVTGITAESTGLDFDRICFVAQNSSNIVEVIRDIGFGYYAKYRNVILDIVDFYHNTNRGFSKY